MFSVGHAHRLRNSAFEQVPYTSSARPSASRAVIIQPMLIGRPPAECAKHEDCRRRGPRLGSRDAQRRNRRNPSRVGGKDSDPQRQLSHIRIPVDQHPNRTARGAPKSQPGKLGAVDPSSGAQPFVQVRHASTTGGCLRNPSGAARRTGRSRSTTWMRGRWTGKCREAHSRWWALRSLLTV